MPLNLSTFVLSEEDDVEEYSPPVDLYRFWLAATFIVGLVGHLFIIWVSFRHMKVLSSPTYYLILHMTVAHFFFLISIPFDYFESPQYGWVFGKYNCRIYHALPSVDAVMSPFITFLLALDRCLAILKSNRSSSWLSPKITTILSFGMWIFAIVHAIPYVLFAKKVRNGEFKSCLLIWPQEHPYLEPILQIGLMVPFVPAFFLYVVALFGLCVQKIKRSRETLPELRVTSGPDVTKLVLGILTVIFIFAAPGLALLVFLSDHWHFSVLTYLDIIINPFLCFVLNQDYQDGLIQTISCDSKPTQEQQVGQALKRLQERRAETKNL